MGTMGHQLTGKIEFHDKLNNLYGWYELGNIKKKTQDNFTGEILQFGKKIVEIRGNYMGYMDFNGVRYFDVRELEHYFFPVLFNPFSNPYRWTNWVNILLSQTLLRELTA